MKIALIGYGKMGQAVREVLSEIKHEIVSISFDNNKSSLDLLGIKKSDVAIDFTSPEIVISNIQKVLPLRIPMVIGTTGWLKDLDKVKKLVSKSKTGLIYGSNFSIGGNIFFEILRNASSMLGNFPDYDVAGIETHHTGKKDSPSGTAKKLSDIIINNIPSKKSLQTESLQREIKKDELHFASVRLGSYFGKHEIMFDSVADEITLTHTAHNRSGFAKGAVFAAEFIKNKKGVYVFEDILRKEISK